MQIPAMSNLATKAPNFTSESGRTAGINSGISRKLLREREKQLRAKVEELDRLTRIPTDDETRKQTTLKQIDALDKRINDALDDDDEERFLKLTAAKERLWKLVQPTAGVNKPRQASSRPHPPTPSQIETPQEPPVSQSQQ
jgi:hypothetical protein